ncbi:MAG: hypothetical protein RLZZ436_984 [Planctomycetota bacterium]
MAKTTKPRVVYTQYSCTRIANTSAEFPVFLCETLCTLWLKRNTLRTPFHHPSFALPAMRRARKPGPLGFRPAAHVFGIAFARIMSGRAEAPGCDFAPWCAAPGRGVSGALAGHFTRRLPPGGSWVLTSHFRLSSLARALYPRASAHWLWGSLKFCDKTVEDLGRRGWDDETV